MRGGARVNSGRPKMSPEQIQLREMEQRRVLIDELVFPSLVMCMKSDPGHFKNHYLEIELSKVDIRAVYGAEGLREWMSFFSLEKIGGIDRFGVGYKSKWKMNLSKYGVLLKMLETVGRSIADLPDVWFPPEVMLEKLRVIRERRERKLWEKHADKNGRPR